MKLLKKILSILLTLVAGWCIIVVALALVFLLIIWLLQITGGNNGPKHGYYKKEEFWDKEGFQDFTDYCKYYYEDKYDAKFAEDKYYTKVKEDNITEVVEYFEEFEHWMLPKRANEYDFDKSQITIGDYVRIEGKGKDISFNVYLYDIETNILYYIHNNI